jgi:hypothetical protein
MDKQILNAIKSLEKRVVDLYKKIKGISLIPGPPGLQGLQGVPGIQGTVGPAGLNWQGAWDSNASYIEDDAVGYAGASWFCISPVSGGNAPDANTTNWALLASQGAPGLTGNTGPMPWNLPATVYNNGADYGYGDAVTYEGGYYYRTGNPNNPGYPPTPGSINGSWTPVADRGLPGVAPIKTRGQLYGSEINYQDQILLSYDINLINDGSESSFFKLPDTTVVGKEVIVDVMGNNCRVYGFNGGLAFETAVNGSNSQILTVFNDLIKFTSIGANFWIVEYLDRVAPVVPKVTLKQNVLSLTQAQVLAMNTTPFIILASNTPGVVRIPKDIIIKRVGTSGTPYTIPGGNQLQITFNNDTEAVSNFTLLTTPFTESTGVAFANINDVYTQSATTNFLESISYRLNVYGGMNPSGGTGNFLVYVTYEEIIL